MTHPLGSITKPSRRHVSMHDSKPSGFHFSNLLVYEGLVHQQTQVQLKRLALDIEPWQRKISFFLHLARKCDFQEVVCSDRSRKGSHIQLNWIENTTFCDSRNVASSFLTHSAVGPVQDKSKDINCCRNSFSLSLLNSCRGAVNFFPRNLDAWVWLGLSCRLLQNSWDPRNVRCTTQEKQGYVHWGSD